MKLIDIFFNQKLISSKHKNYFLTYEKLFQNYRDKEITFVEIGAKNGGSLMMWREYFSKNSRVIGIDINEKALELKKYGIEIFIGDQASEVFWNNFFKSVGKVDIVLDDGGHTNAQQIITSACCVPNIKDNGLLVIEDTFTSYMNKFSNPNKYSFVSYAKKKIDDINYRYPDIGLLKNSLNKYIYSIEFFESIVCFKINRELCKTNEEILNNGKEIGIKDLRYGDQKLIKKIRSQFSFFSKLFILRSLGKLILKYLNKLSIKIKDSKNKKYFF